MPLRVRESPIYILMQDCRKTSVLGEVTHEPRTATFESKRERVQIGYIRALCPSDFLDVSNLLRLPGFPGNQTQ